MKPAFLARLTLFCTGVSFEPPMRHAVSDKVVRLDGVSSRRCGVFAIVTAAAGGAALKDASGPGARSREKED